MKTQKLKLYGEKGDFSDFIAEIYIKDNKLVVESQDKKARKELYDEINRAVEKGESFCTPCPRHIDGVIEEGFCLYKFGHPEFLRALSSEFWEDIGLGKEGKFGNKTFGGYKIIAHKSEIIEE